MIETWLFIGFVVAGPLFIYIGALALLNKLLKKEKSALAMINIHSKQPTQCQVSKTAGPSGAA